MLRISVLATTMWLVVAGTAAAQATSTATPNTPSAGTRLHFDVDATLPPVAGRIPKGLTFTAPSGFRVDLKAVAKRCTHLQATLDECPAKSGIGKGSLVIQVTQPGQVRDVTVPLHFYLKSNKAVYAVAFLAGTRVIPGTIDRSDGMVLDFDPLPDPPAFPQVSYLLKHVTVTVGAKRKVVTTVRKGKGKKRRKRTTVHHLLRTPATCPGTWPATVTFTYPDQTTDVLPTPAECVKG